jgi:hypothetical protein
MKAIYLYQQPADGGLVNPRLDGVRLGRASDYSDAEIDQLVAERNRRELELWRAHRDARQFHPWTWCILRDD